MCALGLYRVIKKSLCTWWLQYNRQMHRNFLITLYIAQYFLYHFHIMDCGIKALFHGEFAVWSQGKWNVPECIVPMFAVLLFEARMGLKIHFICSVSLCQGKNKNHSKILEYSAEFLGITSSHQLQLWGRMYESYIWKTLQHYSFIDSLNSMLQITYCKQNVPRICKQKQACRLFWIYFFTVECIISKHKLVNKSLYLSNWCTSKVF